MIPMGKATIISGGTDGLYKINYHIDRTKIQTQIDAMTLKIEGYETGLIPTFESDAAAKLATLNARLADLNAAIDADVNPRPATAAVMLARHAHEQAVIALDTAKIELAALTARKTLLEKILPPASYETSAWCADFNENLSGNVGVIEIPGERAVTPVIIKPAGEDGALAAYIQHADGIMVPVLGISPERSYYNQALLPAWQKHMPGYRLGAITEINTTNGDLCSVTLDPAKSTQQDLDINKNTALTNVPIVYMSCNGAAFEVGARVVVAFTGSGPGTEYTPTVIGFESNPQECCPDFSATPLTDTVNSFITFENGALGATPGNWQLWGFGDAALLHFNDPDAGTPSAIKPTHRYQNTGIYSVSRSLSASAIWDDISASVAANVRYVEKETTTHSSESDAWTEYTGLSWTTNSGSNLKADHFLWKDGSLYYYKSLKLLFNIDLTAYDASKKIYLAIAPRFAGLAEKGSGITSSLGGSLNSPDLTDMGLALPRYYNLLDLTPYAGQLLTDVEIGDNSSFPRFAGSTRQGWRTYNGSGGNPEGIIIYRKQDVVCTKTKTDYITVT